MVLPRRSIPWSSLLQQRVASTARPSFRQSVNVAKRRTYASGGHGHAKATSDLPWLAGAIAVTVPSAYYIGLPQKHEGGHGHGEHHGEHAEHEEHEGEEEKTEQKPAEGGDEKDEGDNAEAESNNEKPDDEENADDKPNDGNDGSKTEDKKDEKNDDKVDGKDSKADGKNKKPAKDSGAEDPKRTPPGAQGSEESGAGKDAQKDAARDGHGGPNTTSGKQEGISNQDTGHSTNIHDNPEKSKKGEGSPETSKTKGTVDSKRPQR